MAAKNPFWEIKPTHHSRYKNDQLISSRVEWYAHLKGRNGRIVVTTETYPKKASVRKAIRVVDPLGQFDVRETLA